MRDVIRLDSGNKVSTNDVLYYLFRAYVEDHKLNTFTVHDQAMSIAIFNNAILFRLMDMFGLDMEDINA